jgi:PBSX family phage terminase large subunit
LTLDFKVLPHQRKFISSNTNTMLVAGYGSGKSYAGVYKTILKKLQYPKHRVAYYLPTYPLVKDIAFGKFTEALEDLGLEYKLNKSDKEIYITNYGTIIFRSMDNAETIVGYEVAYSLIDEADILPTEKMDLVYKKILSRNRSIENPTVDAVSTPEGFKWLYNMANSGFFNVIKAKTYDNKFLPKKYIADLEDQYPEELLKAYLNGEFVNLTSGTVYNKFNREKHNTNLTHSAGDHLIVGQDFNIGGCCSVIWIKNGQGLFAVDEMINKDTFEVITSIKKRYPQNTIEVIPDASGIQGNTSATKSDIQLLRDAGFKVNAPSKNPRVMDRIISANNGFEKGYIFINVDKCPNFVKALEQQAYNDKGEPEKFSGAGTVDDWNDAGTYPIHRLFGVDKPRVSSYSGSFL